jgi:hypothetical protein
MTAGKDRQLFNRRNLPMASNEQVYYDALKKIARDYMTPAQALRSAKNVGLEPDEHLEMCYENIQAEAEYAIHGKRRPSA